MNLKKLISNHMFLSIFILGLVLAIACGGAGGGDSDDDDSGDEEASLETQLEEIGVTSAELDTCLEDNGVDSTEDTLGEVGDDAAVSVCICIFAASDHNEGSALMAFQTDEDDPNDCAGGLDDNCQETDSIEDCFIANFQEEDGDGDSNDDSEDDDNEGGDDDRDDQEPTQQQVTDCEDETSFDATNGTVSDDEAVEFCECINIALGEDGSGCDQFVQGCVDEDPDMAFSECSSEQGDES